MRAAVRTDADEFTSRGQMHRAIPRQTTVVVRRVQPWSVLRFSLLFYFCLMLIFLLALLILYWVLGLIGVLDSLSHLIGEFLGNARFAINGFYIFSRLFLIGAVGVVVWSFVNLCVALLYNLVSDVVGGIQVTLSERR
jgi:transmembrane protein DUF3566